MDQLAQVLKEIDSIQYLKNLKVQNHQLNFNILNISGLSGFYGLVKKCFFIVGIAFAKCIGSSSNFSITNKHRMMGEHSR